MKKFFTYLVATVFIFNVSFAQNVGEVAPDFVLKDLNNQDYKLSANKGKVILVFLVGNSCPFCVASAPGIKSDIISVFADNTNFQTIVIDTWDGSTSAVQNFKNTTNLNATYLQKGSGVASSWKINYDRLVVIDSEGKMAFKGTRAAGSDVNNAKTVIQNALNNLNTSINDSDASEGFLLGQNYPNPFREQTKIKFNIGRASHVSVSVFDITGKKVLIPLNHLYLEGSQEISIEKNQIKKGIYFYKLEADDFISTKRMIVQ